MKYLSIVLVLFALSGCSLDPRKTAGNYVAVAERRASNGMYEQAMTLYVRAIHIDPLNGEAYRGAGLTALKLERWGEAAQYLERAVGLEPERAELYSQLANLYLFAYGVSNPAVRQAIILELQSLSSRLHSHFPESYDDIRLRAYLACFGNDPKTALVNFEVADRLKPHQPELVLAYGQTLIAAGQVDKAEALARSSATDDPSTAQLFDALVVHYLQSKRPADVERILKFEIDHHPTLSSARLELAAYQFSAGRIPEMANVLRDLASDRARFPDGAMLAGDFYLRIRDLQHAREFYQAGIDRGGDARYKYQKRLAEVLVKDNKLPEARELMREFLRQFPNDTEALAIDASIKVISADQKELHSAIAEMQPLILRLPDDFVLKYVYGRALLLSGDAASAVLQFQDALKLRPDYLWARVALTHISVLSGDYGKMIVLAKGITTDPGLNVPFDTAGQRPQERPLYDSMLAIRPYGPAVLGRLAAEIAETGTGVDAAYELAQRATQQRPDDRDVQSDLGFVYVKMNNPDTAIKLLAPLVQSDPKRALYRYRLAMALLEKGDREKARQECRAAMQGIASTEEIAKIKDLLFRLG